MNFHYAEPSPDPRSLAEQVGALDPAERASILADMTDAEAALLEWDWSFWGRPAQLMPAGDWSNWLILAGRGFGKSRTGTETIRQLVCGPTPLAKGEYGRVAIIAETAADARDVLVEGKSGILNVHPKDFRPVYEPSKRRLTWPNGAVATLYNATEPDQLRGPEHDLALCDELAKWAYARDAWDMLQFGLRIGERPRAIITTTPRPIPVLKEIMGLSGTIITKGRTMDNRSNLAASFLRAVVERYAGTRLGRQELNAEVLDDVPGALWTREMLDKAKKIADPKDFAKACQRIVVAIDPSGSSGTDEKADEIGMIVAGKTFEGGAAILADRTCSLSPEGWGRRAIEAYHEFKADSIVAEKNFGGDMVRAVIHLQDAKVPVRLVTASRGKAVRAEPVAAMYEQGKVAHIRRKPDADRPSDLDPFEQLEAQYCMFTNDGYIGEGSPDHADAAVWALSDLMLGDGYSYSLDNL